MNKLSLSVLTGVVATGTIAAYQPAANAASFTAQDAFNAGCTPTNLVTSSGTSWYGGSSCTVNGFTLTATTKGTPAVDRNITFKEVGGVFGLGVRNGANPDPSSGEVDYNEVLSVGFGGKALTLKALDLSFLYQPLGAYGDAVFEVALVTATGGTQTGKLRVTGTNTAVWESAEGTVLNLSPSIKGKGGSYRILNPFGDDKITGFNLTALRVFRNNNSSTECSSGGNCPDLRDGKNSDVALTAVHVPEPATVLGLSVVGLAAFARRRQVAKAD